MGEKYEAMNFHMGTRLGSREDQLQKANLLAQFRKELKKRRTSSLMRNGLPREGTTEERKRKGKPRSV